MSRAVKLCGAPVFVLTVRCLSENRKTEDGAI